MKKLTLAEIDRIITSRLAAEPEIHLEWREMGDTRQYIVFENNLEIGRLVMTLDAFGNVSLIETATAISRAATGSFKAHGQMTISDEERDRHRRFIALMENIRENVKFIKWGVNFIENAKPAAGGAGEEQGNATQGETIRPVAADTFGNWLEERTQRLQTRRIKTEDGHIELDRARRLGNLPTWAVVGIVHSNSTPQGERKTLIQYDLTPLDSGRPIEKPRSRVRSACVLNLPALRAIYDELEAEVEQNWPAEKPGQSRLEATAASGAAPNVTVNLSQTGAVNQASMGDITTRGDVTGRDKITTENETKQ